MNLYSVTAPLTIRYPDGRKKLMIEKFRHRDGLLFFEPYWHVNGLQSSVHLIRGDVHGEGPWKIDGHVIAVTGCQATDPDMATLLSEWHAFLNMSGQDYPAPEQIRALATKLGALTEA